MQFRFRQKIIRHWATGLVERLLVLQVNKLVDSTVQWVDASAEDIAEYNLTFSETPIEVVKGT